MSRNEVSNAERAVSRARDIYDESAALLDPTIPMSEHNPLAVAMDNALAYESENARRAPAPNGDVSGAETAESREGSVGEPDAPEVVKYIDQVIYQNEDLEGGKWLNWEVMDLLRSIRRRLLASDRSITGLSVDRRAAVADAIEAHFVPTEDGRRNDEREWACAECGWAFGWWRPGDHEHGGTRRRAEHLADVALRAAGGVR